MKDFIHNNFNELLLTVIIFALALVLILAIHWHDDTTAGWARSLIGAVVLGITTLLKPKDKKEQ